MSLLISLTFASREAISSPSEVLELIEICWLSVAIFLEGLHRVYVGMKVNKSHGVHVSGHDSSEG